MKKIKLTKGEFAIVDDNDYQWLDSMKWHLFTDTKSGKKYAKRGVSIGNRRGVTVFMHRLILGLHPGCGLMGDHVDNNGLNNQRSNLRAATPRQNQLNRVSHKGATSKYLGVSWANTSNKWIVHIRAYGVKTHIGLFIDEKEAALAYNEAAKAAHGEFANLNKIK